MAVQPRFVRASNVAWRALVLIATVVLVAAMWLMVGSLMANWGALRTAVS